MAHLSPTRCVFDVVFRAAASLDVAQFQLLVQDLDLRWGGDNSKTLSAFSHQQGGLLRRERGAQEEEVTCEMVSLIKSCHP